MKLGRSQFRRHMHQALMRFDFLREIAAQLADLNYYLRWRDSRESQLAKLQMEAHQS